ncbi:hypothetical protein JOD54_000143 [Actinokineospora baliensis]|uniref:hypothetical protein n=1 Tax=Actinokineospora baliensis TaxID=547056 RepID=UPI00195B6F73|nr:hypothetical protein [Actinokineospora baliensis]MBM7769939.1 hypothetical protein [Actinokineospora baliensis]
MSNTQAVLSLRNVDTPTPLWDELTRLNHAVRHHLHWHTELTVSSVALFSTNCPSSRVEIHVPGDRAEACARVLAWRESLLDTTVHLEVGQEPKVSVYGRFFDGTAVAVTAPLSAEDVDDLDTHQLGDTVFAWLQTHAA